jgi:hypothetical protein
MDKLDTAAHDGGEVDLTEWIRYFAFDFMSVFAYVISLPPTGSSL